MGVGNLTLDFTWDCCQAASPRLLKWVESHGFPTLSSFKFGICWEGGMLWMPGHSFK